MSAEITLFQHFFQFHFGFNLSESLFLTPSVFSSHKKVAPGNVTLGIVSQFTFNLIGILINRTTSIVSPSNTTIYTRLKARAKSVWYWWGFLSDLFVCYIITQIGGAK